ncbi:hypothetical protein [Capnocytophaga gingivalis]|uniref:hypothetical protein n=1 Tax=Capnocytophaga gingivalis TaxID=1017 RepID=UPI0023F12E4B|nr:hypothetical protein [Capnocytophaga gingivalis]
MDIKRDESHCYAAVITEDGLWQKGEEYFLEGYTETLIYNERRILQLYRTAS